MNDNYFGITQKAFPFISKKVEVNLDLQKVKVSYKSMFGKQVFNVNLYEVDENAQRITKDSLGWLIFCVLFSMGILINLARPIVTLINGSFDFTQWVQLFFSLTLGFLLWGHYFNKRSD